MNTILMALAHELTKDKWLAFVFVMIMLAAYIHTKNEALLQILIAATGLLAGLLRGSSATQNIASGEGATVKTETPVVSPTVTSNP